MSSIVTCQKIYLNTIEYATGLTLTLNLFQSSLMSKMIRPWLEVTPLKTRPRHGLKSFPLPPKAKDDTQLGMRMNLWCLALIVTLLSIRNQGISLYCQYFLIFCVKSLLLEDLDILQAERFNSIVISQSRTSSIPMHELILMNLDGQNRSQYPINLIHRLTKQSSYLLIGAPSPYLPIMGAACSVRVINYCYNTDKVGYCSKRFV